MTPAAATADVTLRLERLLAGLLFVVALTLLVFRAGALSWTWDESIDMSIVRCVHETGSPFACVADISQTRLPVYLHVAVAAVSSSVRAHYALSAVFALANLGLVYAFARRHFGARTALLALALAATAPSLLASGRMLLSHANVIFTTFSLVTVLAFERFGRTGERRWFWTSAVAFGLAVASSVLGVFHGLVVGGLWLVRPRPRSLAPWWPLAYGAVAVAVFFTSTVIYVRPENLEALVRATVVPDTFPYPFWNYLDSRSGFAPRWYSALLAAIRLGPWWTALLVASPLLVLRRARPDRRALLVIWGVTVAYLLGKALVFRYDAPHQQAPWYPLALVFVAAAAVALVERAGLFRPLAVAALAVLVGLQVHDVQRFFPNYLFYGAQYGDRFIGEFYGPAVLHKQGRSVIDAEIAALAAAEPDAAILVADNNGFEQHGPQFVPFSRRDPAVTYRYALADRLHATHLRFPERDDYNALLASRYRVRRSLDYPLGEWAYRIYELVPTARAAPTAPDGAAGASTSTVPSTIR